MIYIIHNALHYMVSSQQGKKKKEFMISVINPFSVAITGV